jgi:hypothetical protein
VVLPSDFPPGEAEVIVVRVEPGEDAPRPKLTMDEFFSARLAPPPGVGPVTLADMEKAISDGASGRGRI